MLILALLGVVVVSGTTTETTMGSVTTTPGILPRHIAVGVVNVTAITAGTVFTTRLRVDGVEERRIDRTILGFQGVLMLTPPIATVELTGQWSNADPNNSAQTALFVVL